MIIRRRILKNIEEEFTGEFVDLGLPSGLLWATGNIVKDDNGNYSIGKPIDYGCYFSWGNIDGHNADEGYDFSSESYKITPGYQVGSNIENTDSDHDAVLACLGSPWHLPTHADFQELCDNTDGEWATIDGVNGWKFMNRDNNSIYVFFPAAGAINNSSHLGVEESGSYWSSSRLSSTTRYRLHFTEDYANYRSNVAPNAGFSVRAVRSA